MSYKVGVVKKITFLFMTMALAVALVACQGAVGKTGEPGDTGPPGPPGTPPEPVNKAPISLAVGPIQAPALVEEGEDATIVVSGYFRDPDGDALQYSHTVDPVDVVVTAALAANEAGEHVLTITPVARGDATITVMASDGALSASVMINATVHPEGMAPPTYDESLDDVVTLTPGDQHVISGTDIGNAFHESEGESLTYAASGSDDTIVMVTPPDVMDTPVDVTITALSMVGDATVTITVTDEDDLTVEHVIEVSVRAALEPALTDMEPEDADLSVGGLPDERDVAGYFNNHGLEDLKYSADSSDDDVAMESMVGSMLTISPRGEGMATITVTASNVHGMVSQMITVNVVGTPPTRNGEIADRKLMIGESEVILLDQYFTPGARSDHDDLTYSVASGDSDKVTAAVARGSEALTITGVASGMATVTVTAEDNHGETETQEFDVTVTEEVAQAPLPTSTEALTPQTLTTDAAPMEIMLSDHFSGATEYRVGSTDTEVVMVAEADGVLTLTPMSHGTSIVSVTPSNASGTGATELFNVTVRAKPALKTNRMFEDINIEDVNDGDATAAPDEAAISDAIKKYTLTEDITDPDGDVSELMFTTTTEDAETVAVYVTGTNDLDNSTHTKAFLDKATSAEGPTVTVRGRKIGSTTVTIMATDEDGLEKKWTFTVTVVSANTAPNAVAAAATDGTIKDLDGVPAATRMDVDDVEKVIDDKLITALFDNGTEGADFLRGDVVTFDLKVYPNGTAVTGFSGTPGIVGSDNRLLKKDEDGYTAPLAADKAQVSGTLSTTRWTGSRTSKITVTLRALRGNTTDPVPGTATEATDVVAIIATDKFGLSAVHLINVRVNHTMKAEGAQDKPRRLSGTGENGVVAAGGTSENKNGVLEMTWDGKEADNNNSRTVALVAAVADGGGYFHDPDGDTITCSYVRSPETGVAAVSLAANTLTIQPSASTGTLTVTVTCKETLVGDSTATPPIANRFGPSVTDTLTVRVAGKTFSQR